jgi:6-phosphogluconolactonase
MNQGSVVHGADLADVALRIVKETIAGSMAPVRIALSGGTTPRALFEKMRGADIPWDVVEWFWVDERMVPKAHERSNAGEAHRILFDHVDAETYAMPTEGDGEMCAAIYARLLHNRLGKALRFDLVLLGVGDDGHTASLFPNEPDVHRTESPVLHVPARADRESRLSLSASVIQEAKAVVVLASGESKALPLRRARGLDTGALEDTPSVLLQKAKGALTYVVDAHLAARIV